MRALIAQSRASLEVRGYCDYYPYGMVLRSGGETYRYGYQGAYAEKDGETDWNAFELRMYDSRIAKWLSFDPKKASVSPYSAMDNDPIKNIDKDGGDPSEHLDPIGNLIKNYDDGDNSVFVHASGITAADLDKVYSATNHAAGGIKLGELGDLIDADGIFKNLLSTNMNYAAELINPFTFNRLVKGHGDWDLKNNTNTIWGIARKFDRARNPDNLEEAPRTYFMFNKHYYLPEDLGNFHYGAVGKAMKIKK